MATAGRGRAVPAPYHLPSPLSPPHLAGLFSGRRPFSACVSHPGRPHGPQETATSAFYPSSNTQRWFLPCADPTNIRGGGAGTTLWPDFDGAAGRRPQLRRQSSRAIKCTKVEVSRAPCKGPPRSRDALRVFSGRDPNTWDPCRCSLFRKELPEKT